MELKDMDKVWIEITSKEEADELKSIRRDGGFRVWMPSSVNFPYLKAAWDADVWSSGKDYKEKKVITLAEFRKEQNIMKYSAGDVLVNDVNTLVIQGNIGAIYLSIDDDGSPRSDTESQLDRYDYTLKTDTPITELTLEQVAEKMNIPVSQLRIKD